MKRQEVDTLSKIEHTFYPLWANFTVAFSEAKDFFMEQKYTCITI